MVVQFLLELLICADEFSNLGTAHRLSLVLIPATCFLDDALLPCFFYESKNNVDALSVDVSYEGFLEGRGDLILDDLETLHLTNALTLLGNRLLRANINAN